MSVELELASYPHLDERVVILRAGDVVDGVFVLTERFGVLIDTLATPNLCRQALGLVADRLQGRSLVVVNSHMDWDHFWGNGALGSVPIIAHSRALDRLSDGACHRELSEKAVQDARFRGVEIVVPTMTFAGDGMKLHGGDLTLELLHTPGHTPDHIAVWIPELHVCLAVDAAEYPIPEVWSDDPAHLRDLCASLRRLQALQPRHAILAHGRTAAPSVIDDNLAYFAKLTCEVASQNLDVGPVDRLLEQAQFQLEAFVALPEAMASETRDFYRRCHRTNLGAAVVAHRAGMKL